ncbi:hypothetical protein EON66_12380 [archaeon]|nr:MAG: hypothetical protein EON66_12380 [archaeon]
MHAFQLLPKQQTYDAGAMGDKTRGCATAQQQASMCATFALRGGFAIHGQRIARRCTLRLAACMPPKRMLHPPDI